MQHIGRAPARQVRILAATLLATALLLPGSSAQALVEYVEQTSWHRTQKVFALAQTPDGFLWAGSDAGLLRFDGRDFKVYTQGTFAGLGGNIIRALSVDPTGTLLIGLDDGQGVSRFSGERFETLGARALFKDVPVLALAASANGELWIGTSQGLVWCESFERPASCKHVESLRGQNVLAIMVAPSGGVWIGAKSGLYRGSTKGAVANTQNFGPVLALALDGKGRLWISDAEQGIYSLAPDGQLQLVLTTAVGDRLLAGFSSLAVDDEDSVWVGWNWGYGRIVEDDLSPRFLTGLSTVALLADKEGGIWSASYWGVVFRAAALRVSTETHSAAGEEPIVFGVESDAQDNIWLAQTKSVVRLSSTGSTRFASGQELPSWCPRSLSASRLGGVWLATCDKGLFRVNPDAVISVEGTGQGPLSNIQTVLEDSNGVVWLGTVAGEFFRYANQRFERIEFPNGYCDPTQPRPSVRPGIMDECAFSVTAIEESSKGGVWLALRRNGLRRISEGKVEAYSKTQGLPTKELVALYEDQEGTLWIGTQAHGLVRFRDGQFQAVDRSHGLPAQSIHGIVEDDQAQLWMSGESGVFRISKTVLNDFFAGVSDRVVGYAYGVPDGLKSPVTVQSFSKPILFTNDKRVLVPLDKGLAVIHAKRVSDTEGFSQVILEDVRINGASVGKASFPRIDLAFGRSMVDSLEVAFVLPNFDVPHRVDVNYRLNPLDGEWKSAGSDRVLRLVGVPPGTYHLEFQPTLDGKPWGKPLVSSLLVLRSFYRRPLFFLIVGLALVPLGAAFYVLRLQYQQARFTTVLSERNRIARELHDTLAQYFTGISYQLARLSIVLRDKPHEADQINEVTKMMLAQCRIEARQAIHNLRSEHMGHKDLLESLQLLADETRLSGDTNVELHIEGQPRPVDETIQAQLLRIVQEATVNALTHADASCVAIRVVFGAGELSLTVKDDGEGFDLKDKPMHFGLQGIRERCKAIGGQLEIASSPQDGTTVHVRVALDAAPGKPL